MRRQGHLQLTKLLLLAGLTAFFNASVGFADGEGAIDGLAGGTRLSPGKGPTRAELEWEAKKDALYRFPAYALADVPEFLERVNPNEHGATYLRLAALTAGLIYFDQDIIDESQRFSKRIGLIDDNDDGRQTHVVFSSKVFGLDADIHIPETFNTYLFFIGDGLTSIGIAAGLGSYGSFANDLRSLRTAAQMMEAMILTGIFIITTKMSTGRESPFRVKEPGGVWRPAPGVKAYVKDVSKHDAYPSGHIATVMAGVEVLSRNYPEKSWIKPSGYVAMGLLMFSMLNNGVHWASDYPLGIAIGYTAANVVLDQSKKRYVGLSGKASRESDAHFSFSFDRGRPVLARTWNF